MTSSSVNNNSFIHVLEKKRHLLVFFCILENKGRTRDYAIE